MMERMIRKIGAAAGAGVLFGVLFFLAGTAHAVDGIALEAGHGDDSTSLIRFSITDTWRKREPTTREWRLAGYWEFSAGIWDNKDESTADIGITPVFRIERNRFYVEAAIGAHLVQTHISAHRTFSTSLQFGDHLGAGWRFGEGERYDFGIRVQHLSNGGINKPNPGINFFLVRLQRELE
jgi:lipid A 3-O-deacylase